MLVLKKSAVEIGNPVINLHFFINPKIALHLITRRSGIRLRLCGGTTCQDYSGHIGLIKV
ncbi:hypothetical protein MYP_4069 [Sporocytophaga myxococcoides]|uniref:Uncharacterized protein n=1 Tax=Sporocytophaga myxococcoides TaxID=153721 RepID=A0A098LK51_9BACT|nr:hypothetical protein MYP_4069 [Sporocytophaga myxococcoides]